MVNTNGASTRKLKKNRYPGLQRERSGWRVYVSVHGRLYAKRFPRDTPLTLMRQWREAKRAELLHGGLPTTPRAQRTFGQDVEAYLERLAMAHQAHLEMWVEQLAAFRAAKGRA